VAPAETPAVPEVKGTKKTKKPATTKKTKKPATTKKTKKPQKPKVEE
jgi:hypothetical protein